MTRGPAGIRALLAAFALGVFWPAAARAHSVHTASIRLTIEGSRVFVVERVPAEAGTRLQVVLPPSCLLVAADPPREHGRFVSFRDQYRCGDGIDRLEVRGFDGTLGEAWIVVDRGDQSLAGLVRAEAPTLDLRPNAPPPLGAYLLLGVEHVLGGLDHLLFVLGLLMVVRARGTERRVQRVVGTITAFTVAHSITLALATLGRITLPGPPVEIGIALSILLLADELARAPSRAEPSWTLRHPAIVAFAFGLLHGFGFAGALADVGVPPDRAWEALALFNLGVEAGQLAFVGAVVGLLAASRLARRTLLRARPPARRLVSPLAVHVLGGAAFFFLLDRLTSAF